MEWAPLTTAGFNHTMPGTGSLRAESGPRPSRLRGAILGLSLFAVPAPGRRRKLPTSLMPAELGYVDGEVIVPVVVIIHRHDKPKGNKDPHQNIIAVCPAFLADPVGWGSPFSDELYISPFVGNDPPRSSCRIKSKDRAGNKKRGEDSLHLFSAPEGWYPGWEKIYFFPAGLSIKMIRPFSF